MSILEDIRVDKIVPNPLQHRDDSGDLTSLVDSIKAVGLIEPVVVRLNKDGFTLLAGHRRVEAAKLAGLKKIPAIVHSTMDERTEAGMLLAENTVRRDLTVVEEANGIQTMLNVGWKEPGTAIGRSTERVAQSVKVAAMPDALKKVAVQATLDEAYALAEFADDKKALKALKAALGKGDFAWVVRNQREAKHKRDAKAAAKARLEAEGCLIVDHVWDSKQKPLVELGISVEDHRSCPGHAAYIEGYGDCLTTYVCTDAPSYGHATATSAEDAKREKQRAKERAEYEKREADWGIAREVRVAFVHKLLHAHKLASGIMPWAFGVLYDDVGSSYELASRFRAIWGNKPGAITEKYAPAMIAALAVAAIESVMGRNYNDAVRHSKAYLELLATEGYAMSPVERAYYDDLVVKVSGIKASDECDQDCEACTHQCEDAS